MLLFSQILGHATKCKENNCEINRENMNEVIKILYASQSNISKNESKFSAKELLLSFMKRRFTKYFSHL